MSRKRSLIFILVCGLVYALAAFLCTQVVAQNGIYPSGSDTFCHIYKGDVLYRAIREGEWYPLYDPMWYNGVEMLRYWAPLPVYVLAFCQFLGGGDPLQGYLIFVGVIVFFGGLAFAYVGLRLKRPFIGAFFGLLWFFIPNNLYALFAEGNLPRSLSMIFLPLFVYEAESYLKEGEKSRLLWTALYFVLIVLCHSGYAGMIALSMLVLLLFYASANHCFKRAAMLTGTIVAAFLLTGIWLLPSLIGGISNTDSSEVMAEFFQNIFRSLDPTKWFREGVLDYYFGIAVFLTAVFGLLCSGRRSRPLFASGLLIFLLTGRSAFYLLKLLPGSQYLWMLRFLSISICFVLYGCLCWKSLKKPVQAGICFLLLLDCICGLQLMAGNGSGSTAEERLAQVSTESLLDRAKNVTKQRLALMDLSTLGAGGPFIVSGIDVRTAGTYGAGWQSATTAANIAQLNRAVERGHYAYLFDRALEMGNDSVLVRTLCAPEGYDNWQSMDAQAARSGYGLLAENGDWRLYHADLPECFGLVSHYDAIGIGSGAGSISLTFPDVEETSDPDLSHYSFEELSKYRTVYLNGFEASEREAAEDMLRRLADAGVRVVIMADGMPEDPSIRRKSFLGVDCNTVRFKNGYPDMTVHGELLNTDLFAEGFSEWETVYLNGLSEVYGSVAEDDLTLAFYGTVYNKNIIFLGLNLSYHYALTLDPSVEGILRECFAVEDSELPARRVVPLTMSVEKDRIVIDSPENGVNTTLSWHDCFETESTLKERFHLCYVDAGRTEIKIKYPYFFGGLALSLFAAALLVLLFAAAGKMKEKEENAAGAAQAAGTPSAETGS